MFLVIILKSLKFAPVKGNWHIISILAAVLAAILPVSCSKASVESPLNDSGETMVLASGYVYRAVPSEETPQPIKGIAISLAAVDPSDLGKPVLQSHTHSIDSGLFILYLEYRPGYEYILSASDTDGKNNGGEYTPETIRLNITGAPELDENTGLYTHFFWNSDFHLDLLNAN